MFIHKLVLKIKRVASIMTSYSRGSIYGIRPGYLHKIDHTHFDDTENKDEWQKEVYQYALKCFNTHKYTSVLDVGCGSAYKLRTFFQNLNYTGVEIGNTLEFLKNHYPHEKWCTLEECKNQSFDLIILSDVIEHIADPYNFLHTIISQIDFNKLIISTPDRNLLPGPELGPPLNPSHYREWNKSEFNKFVSSMLTVENHFISNKDQGTQCLLASPKK